MTLGSELNGRGQHLVAGDDIPVMPIWCTLEVAAASKGALDEEPKAPTHFKFTRIFQESVAMLEDLDCVTIAAVDGICMGGGLVNRIVEPADLEGEVQSLTDPVLAKNHYAVRRTKLALNKAGEWTAERYGPAAVRNGRPAA